MPAVLPDFNQPQAPSVPASLALQSGNDAQSWMNSTQERTLRDAHEQRQRQIFDATIPAVAAKVQADEAQSVNTLASAKIAQDFAKQAALQMPQATQEYTDALQLADFDEKATAMAMLQGKYGWLGQVPGTAGLAKAIDNSRVNAHTEALANMHMQQQLEQTRALVAGRQTVAETTAGARAEVAGINADARQVVADTGANARITAAGIGAGARADAADTATTGAMQREEYRQNSRAADDFENAAIKATDPAKAADLLKKAQQYREKAESVSRAAATPAATAAAGGPGRNGFSIPNVNMITVGGRNYPIFKDAGGNRAYRTSDGKYVPLDEAGADSGPSDADPANGDTEQP